MRLYFFPSIAILVACQTANPNAQSSASNESRPVPSVLDSPVEFSGPQGSTAHPTTLDEIRIGLFAPDDPAHSVGSAMFHGARLAIDLFNGSGGLDGLQLRLMSRWDDDPWRGGSKQMIKLVYEDSVWAVIGSVDGAATHIAEQVVSKAWLPLLSPVSADPTLTYIRIPWMFRLPPDDEEQGAVLIRDGIAANSLSNIGLITSIDHDGRVFGEEMRRQMSAASVPPLFHLQVSLNDLDFGTTVDRVASFAPDAVVARFPAHELLGLLTALEVGGLDIPVLIPWIPGLQPSDLHGRYSGSIFYLSPFSETEHNEYAVFSQTYSERYGSEPTPSAAYTYDAVNLLIQSIRSISLEASGGLNRAALRDALVDQTGSVGVTGPISWDNAGGNQTSPVMRSVKRRDSRN